LVACAGGLLEAAEDEVLVELEAAFPAGAALDELGGSVVTTVTVVADFGEEFEHEHRPPVAAAASAAAMSRVARPIIIRL
jgi:hypothetical protein